MARSRSRRTRIVAAVLAQPGHTPAARLCAAAATQTVCPGVSISLIADHELHTVAATGTGRSGDRLQATLGEGPSLTSFHGRWPVLVADLSEDDRWPMFATAARDSGLRAVFAFPLRRGAIRLGAFTLYRSAEGRLGDEEHGDAAIFAQLATDLLIASQADSDRDADGRPDGDADGREDGNGNGDRHRDGDGLSAALADGDPDAWVVHQATGMVSAQASVGMADALALLRAHAYATERPLDVVAADVVGRRLRLEGGTT